MYSFFKEVINGNQYSVAPFLNMVSHDTKFNLVYIASHYVLFILNYSLSVVFWFQASYSTLDRFSILWCISRK